jgi:hypothetical protein
MNYDHDEDRPGTSLTHREQYRFEEVRKFVQGKTWTKGSVQRGGVTTFTLSKGKDVFGGKEIYEVVTANEVFKTTIESVWDEELERYCKEWLRRQASEAKSSMLLSARMIWVTDDRISSKLPANGFRIHLDSAPDMFLKSTYREVRDSRYVLPIRVLGNGPKCYRLSNVLKIRTNCGCGPNGSRPQTYGDGTFHSIVERGVDVDMGLYTVSRELEGIWEDTMKRRVRTWLRKNWKEMKIRESEELRDRLKEVCRKGMRCRDCKVFQQLSEGDEISELDKERVLLRYRTDPSFEDYLDMMVYGLGQMRESDHISVLNCLPGLRGFMNKIGGECQVMKILQVAECVVDILGDVVKAEYDLNISWATSSASNFTTAGTPYLKVAMPSMLKAISESGRIAIALRARPRLFMEMLGMSPVAHYTHDLEFFIGLLAFLPSVMMEMNFFDWEVNLCLGVGGSVRPICIRDIIYVLSEMIRPRYEIMKLVRNLVKAYLGEAYGDSSADGTGGLAPDAFTFEKEKSLFADGDMLGMLVASGDSVGLQKLIGYQYLNEKQMEGNNPDERDMDSDDYEEEKKS